VSSKLWINGSPSSSAYVSIRDRGYTLGDSIFASMRAVNGRIFREARQLERFAASAHFFGFACDHEELRRTLHAATHEMALPDLYLRVTLSRGEGGFRSPGQVHTISVAASATKALPETEYDSGIVAELVEPRRIPRACLPPEHKTGSYLSSVVALREAHALGALEGIQRSISGEIASGVASNLFLLSGNTLTTPRIESDCRPGIVREYVLEIAESLGFNTRETEVHTQDLQSAEEVFFTSTLWDAVAARTIPSLDAQYTTRASRTFRDAIRSEQRRRAGTHSR
jgi:branched-chain amino acid aminotransferase